MFVDENRLFFKNSEADFRDFVSNEKLFFQEHCPEYKELLDKITNIKNNNLKIKKIYEGDVISLSKADTKELQEIIDLQYKLIIMWDKQLYWAGMREAIALEEQIYALRTWKEKKKEEKSKK